LEYHSFVDLYEVLQVSPHADPDTIARVFRHLAKRYHPDNQGTGDRDRFEELARAHRVLTDPEQRAAYDVRYQQERVQHLNLVYEALSGDGHDEDRLIRERLLALLYAQRRRDVIQPSMGEVELERLLSAPREHLEFHLWYLKEKGWVQRTDRGFAITALGVDAVEASRARDPRGPLLAARAQDARADTPPGDRPAS
jgi:curved DNA-binding protein CbpA